MSRPCSPCQQAISKLQFALGNPRGTPFPPSQPFLHSICEGCGTVRRERSISWFLNLLPDAKPPGERNRPQLPTPFQMTASRKSGAADTYSPASRCGPRSTQRNHRSLCPPCRSGFPESQDCLQPFQPCSTSPASYGLFSHTLLSQAPKASCSSPESRCLALDTLWESGYSEGSKSSSPAVFLMRRASLSSSSHSV